MLFYITSVAVMTDMVFVLGGVICMYIQIQANQQNPKKLTLSFLLAAGLSIGLLAKGPLALILFLTPMAVWLFSARSVKPLIKSYQIYLTITVMLFLTLPWYIYAEIKTPGFLNYFIIGEHWERFIQPAWKGDLYGTAHMFPRGSIWLLFFTATFPWCIIVPILLWLQRSKLSQAFKHFSLSIKNDSSNLLLIAWSLTPLVFFTFSGNILWTYVLPSLPALAIILAKLLDRITTPQYLNSILHYALFATVIIKIIFLLELWQKDNFDHKSAKHLISKLSEMKIDLNVVYFYH